MQNQKACIKRYDYILIKLNKNMSDAYIAYILFSALTNKDSCSCKFGFKSVMEVMFLKYCQYHASF